jgi:hypothetical protein
LDASKEKVQPMKAAPSLTERAVENHLGLFPVSHVPEALEANRQ